jgi:Phage integrase, N-terminal SAM-like domain
LKLAEPQVQAFIEFLSVDKQCAALTVRQALSSIVFFYCEVLAADLGQ